VKLAWRLGVLQTKATDTYIWFLYRTINCQNLRNSYLRRKQTEYYGISALWAQILLKLGTHVAS